VAVAAPIGELQHLGRDLTAAFEWNEENYRVKLAGRITIDSSSDLRLFLLRKLSSVVCPVFRIDLAKVTYVDTSGLAVLVGCLKVVRHASKRLQLSGLQRDTPLPAGSDARAALFRGRLTLHAKPKETQAMKLGRVLEIVGDSTLPQLEYIGGLTIQLRQATGSLGRSLHLVGNRNRWRSAIRQMTVIGNSAIPMVPLWRSVPALF
jgi:anti-anti-sigma factor